MHQSPRPRLFVHLIVHRVLRLTLVVAALSLCASAEIAVAEEAEKPLPDKSGYTLFNPTPHDQMRELTPDRPDKTESPYTVDAGHLQLEMSFAAFTENKSEGVRTEAWNIAPINLKVGLCNNADLQLLFDNYLHARTKDQTAGTTATQSGIGDVTVRLKMNLWGNDGGKTAFAILPFVTFPTNTDHLGNNSVEGGVIFPLAVKLPGGWDMAMETAPVLLRNVDDHGYHTEFIDSVTLGHDLFGKLGAYAEFFSNVSTERGSDWVGTVDIGVTYGLTRDIQLDGGLNLGVTHSSDDVNAFTGITARF